MIRSTSRSRSLSWLPLAAGMLLALAAAPAVAQIVDIPAVLDPDLSLPPTVATVQYGHQFKADIEDRGTNISRDTVFLGLGHRAKISDKTTFFALGNYTLHGYDFGGGSGPANRYRWDDVHRIVLAGLVGHDLNDNWRLLGGAMLRSWGESGANFGDTISGGLIGGFDYHTGDDFSVGLIVGAFSQLGGGAGLLPVPTLKWKFAEDWKLNVGMVQFVDPGVGAELTYQVTPEVALGGGITFQSRQYRLSDNQRITGRPNHPNRTDDDGIGQEREVPIFAMVRWRPTKQSTVDLLGGVAVGGNVRVEDQDGNRISDDDYDPAGLLALKAQYFF